MNLLTMLDRIVQGEIVPQQDLIPFLSDPSLANRIEANSKLASAFFMLDDPAAQSRAKEFIRRAWLQSGFSKDLIDLFVKIHVKSGDIPSVKTALKRIAIDMANKGNLNEAMHYFDHWQYVYAIFLKQDKYEFDFDVMQSIRAMGAKFAIHKRSTENIPGRKIRLAYLIKGITEINSVLIKINKQFAKYHDRSAFDVTFFVTETEEQIKASRQGVQHLKDFADLGIQVTAAPSSENRIERLVGAAKQIAQYDPDLLAVSAILANMDHYFVHSVLQGFTTVVFNQGPPPQYTPPDADWSIAWTLHPLIDSPVGCTPVPFEDDLFDPEKVTAAERQQYGIPQDARLILSAGRLPKFQDPQFWRAVETVLRQNERNYFFAVGIDESSRSMIHGMLPEEFSSRITLLGWCEDYLPVVKMADVVFDTYPNGGGYTIVDAMVMGIPVIAFRNNYLAEYDQTNWSPAQEIIQIDELLIERGDIAAFGERMQKLLDDTEFRSQLGDRCRQMIRATRGNPLRMVQRCEQVYRSLLDGTIGSLEFNEPETGSSSAAASNLAPTVSVVLPVIGDCSAIERALNSILIQTHMNWEGLIIGSTSDAQAEAVIERYLRTDQRFRRVPSEAQDLSGLLQTGLTSATGEFFSWLLPAVMYSPRKLALQLSALHSNEDVSIVWGEAENGQPKSVDSQNRKATEPEKFEFARYLGSRTFEPVSVLASTERMKQAGGFCGRYSYAQETELWYRMAASGCRSVMVQENVVERIPVLNRDNDRRSFFESIDLLWLTDYLLSERSFIEIFSTIDLTSDDGVQQCIQQYFDLLLDKGSRLNSALLKERTKKWLTDGLKSIPVHQRKRILQHGKNLFTRLKNDSKVYEAHLQFFTECEGAIGKLRPVPIVLTGRSPELIPPERQSDKRFIDLLVKQRTQFLKAGQLMQFQDLTEYLVNVTGTIDGDSLVKFCRTVLMNGNVNSGLRVLDHHPERIHVNDLVRATYIYSHIISGTYTDLHTEVLNAISSSAIRKHLTQWGDGQAPALLVESVQQWNFEGNVGENTIEHLVKVHCEECGHVFESTFSFDLGPGPSSKDIVCLECFAVRSISDRLVRPFFLKKNSAIVPRIRKANAVPNIAFALRYTGTIGGGVNNMFQCAEWLQSLGCAVTIYSNEPNAPNRQYNGTFTVVKDHGEIPGNLHDVIICMCAIDVPKVMTRYHCEHVMLMCQGYEGYHYGRDFRELRSDKYFFHEIHTLPAKKIVVSQHLVELFKEKFGQNAMYVPNGIDHSVFFPDVTVKKVPPSILFVGNPFQLLKGSDFLMSALIGLQKSSYAVPDLTVHVAIGGGGETMEQRCAMDGFSVVYHVGLNKQGMAELINSVDIVVNTSWYEGFSLPLMEAMACGTPVITTNNMGAESFCTNGVNSFVVEYGDHARLSTLILNILRQKADLSELIRNGVKTAREYSTENTLRAFVAQFSGYLSYSFPEMKVQKLINQYANTRGTSRRTESGEGKRPLFSVLVPTYNQDSFVPQTLESLRSQTVEDWEAVVVNDGSTDTTKQVIEKYALIDDRIRVFHKKNGGVASALNEALRNAQGEWILWLSSDDLFEPHKLATHLREFKQRPEGKFFYTNYSLLYHQTQQKVPGYPGIAPREDQVLSFFYTNFVNGISICIHRSVFDTVGFFNEKLRDAQDFDMWIRIASEYPFEYINDRTCTYRVHPDQGASKFPEAGLYDSALSCAMFLNNNRFERIFPLLDITSNESIDTMIKKTFSVVVDPKSFVNKLGFGGLLIDRLHEWISHACPEEYRLELLEKIRPYVLAVLQKEMAAEVRGSFISLLSAGTDQFLYRPRDVFRHAKQFIEERKKYASVREAGMFDTYLKRFDHLFAERELMNKTLIAASRRLEQKDHRGALSLLETAASKEQDEYSEDLHILKGCAYLGIQEIEQAKSSFEEALALNPNSSEACAGLGEVFYLAELDQQSKTMYEWAVKNDPANATAADGLKRINRLMELPDDHNTLVRQEVELT